jgi:hypothetical protein
MTVLAKAAALLSTADPADLDVMPPAEQRRFANLMWQWQRLAERRLQDTTPSSGVRAQLADGERAP